MKHSPLDLTWLDAEYDALKGVDAAQFFADWTRRSQSALACGTWHLEQRFGDSAAETLDVLLPACGQAVRGVLMFIHGGFWRGSDKAVDRFIAPAFAQAGYAVVLPNYGLCPEVCIKTSVTQMAYARDWLQEQLPVWGLAARSVDITGHSADGHVAAMLSTEAWEGLCPGLH